MISKISQFFLLSLLSLSALSSHTTKKQFFDFMKPIVQAENDRVLQLRAKLLNARQEKNNQDFVIQTAKRYKVLWNKRRTNWTELLRRVDAVALELALAQAADESDWGRSRFAKEGNNYFGQWCYTPGCGLVPKKRPKDATYEVKKFKSPAESVRAYINNINTNKSYKKLRQIRERDRKAGRTPSGYDQAQGLTRYSSRKSAYVHDIQEIITVNKDLMQN